MGPLRLLVLAVLLYVGYRLIRSSFRKNSDSKVDNQSAGTKAKITDVLVEDPVCHKLVPKQQAFRLQDKDEVHYFCSEECCNTFVAGKGEDI